MECGFSLGLVNNKLHCKEKTFSINMQLVLEIIWNHTLDDLMPCITYSIKKENCIVTICIDI